MSFAFNPSSNLPALSESAPRNSRPRRLGRVATLLARVFGAAPGKTPAKASPAGSQRDWSVDVAAMVAAGDEMMLRSRREKFALSVAVFDLSDLSELKSVFGRQVTQQVIAHITAKFQRIATSKGLVVRTGPTVFTLLLPGFGRDRALADIRSVMGHPCCIELEGSDDEIVLVPEFKVQTVRSDTASIADVFASLRREITQTRQLEQTRRNYLQRERESHTRPMELRGGSDSGLLDSDERSYGPSAATIPMPLSGLGR